MRLHLVVAVWLLVGLLRSAGAGPARSAAIARSKKQNKVDREKAKSALSGYDDNDDDEGPDTVAAEGEDGDEDDEVNGDDGEEDEEEDHDDDGGNDDDDEDEDEDEEDGGRASSRTPSSKKRRKSANVLSKGLESASDLANMAMKLTKGSVKAAVDLCANKHVTLMQIVGKWRLQQEIEVRKGAFVACPATIELHEDGSVVTICDGQEFKSEFTFKERAWPRKCTISFQARAFQGTKDKEPVPMFYKGYFKRSIMNPNVVLIRGKVYRLSGKLFFKRQERCGKFKASKRRYN